MRLFGIENGKDFKEFLKTPFDAQHEEATLEQWLEANPDGIIEGEELLVIGRQVTTNLGKFIDILALDRLGNSVVIELKRGRTPRDVVAQALEYASFVEMLSAPQLEELLQKYSNDDSLDLADHHRLYFDLRPEEAVSFNKNQRVVIVGQDVSQEVRLVEPPKSDPPGVLVFRFLGSAKGGPRWAQSVTRRSRSS